MPSFALAFTVYELALVVAGVALIWRLEASPAARAQRQPPPLSRWDISPVDFVIFLWCALFGGLIGQYATVQVLHSFFKVAADTRQIIAGAGFQLGMLTGCVLFRFFPAIKRAELLWPRALKNPVPAGIAVFLMAMPLLSFVGFVWQFLLKQLGIDAERQELFDLFANVSSPALLAVLMVLAVVIAPITEELIFRAGIFRYVRFRLPRSLALLVPALLFSALHYNLGSFAQLVALGMIFSLAYERTGDIRVSMIAHGLFNLNSILLLVSGVDSSS